MTQHTPGPWVWDRDSYRPQDGVITGVGGMTVCRLTRTNQVANGHLIIAAPDLLAALKEIADICQGPAATLGELRHAVEASARAAIRQAEGKEA